MSQIIEQYGYIGLLIVSFLHGAGLPVPAEVLLLSTTALVQRRAAAFLPAVVLFSAANAVGVLVPYIIGRLTGTKVLDKLTAQERRRERLVAGLRRYGALMVAATRIAGFMRYACLLLAGAFAIPYYKVAAATFAGAFIYTVIGYAALQFGWAVVQRWGIYTLIPAALIAGGVWWFRAHRSS